MEHLHEHDLGLAYDLATLQRQRLARRSAALADRRRGAGPDRLRRRRQRQHDDDHIDRDHRLIDDGQRLVQLEAVLQPFHRLEGSRSRESGGTGLGLFIAKELAERQGDALRLSNRDGGGLRAQVRLPA